MSWFPSKDFNKIFLELEDVAENAEERKEFARLCLPFALISALSDSEGLRDMMNVAEKYPDIESEILSCAARLKNDKAFADWTKYESHEYKEFILSLVKR